jgi:hypothetical protein
MLILLLILSILGIVGFGFSAVGLFLLALVMIKEHTWLITLSWIAMSAVLFVPYYYSIKLYDWVNIAYWSDRVIINPFVKRHRS